MQSTAVGLLVKFQGEKDIALFPWLVGKLSEATSSHHLKQCSIPIHEVFLHSFKYANPKIVFEIYAFKLTATFPRVQWVKHP